MSVILLPENLDFMSILELTRGVVAGEEIKIDFGQLNFVEPAGMVGLAAMIESLKSKGVKVVAINAPQCSNFKYLQRMDFFRMFGLYTDEIFLRHDPAGQFSPIEKIDWTTESKVKEVARKLIAWMDDSEVRGYVHNCLSESINNVIDHARSPGFAVAQYYRNDGKYLIAIADSGRGIFESMKDNTGLNVSDEKDALEKACRKGISGSAGIKNEFGEPRNRGMGLFEIDTIVRDAESAFLLCSGGCTRQRRGNQLAWLENSFWQGTMLSIELSRSGMARYNAAMSQKRKGLIRFE